ncbi:ABC transporter permease [Leucobacter chromiireducens]|uniref:ABC transporter permease n=1 Tax=Leucobacter chromiireducens TaxID=283877 RepID=UPI001F14CEA2|nr:ABC transporter permease [Leucobacter chromiireducens]
MVTRNERARGLVRGIGRELVRVLARVVPVMLGVVIAVFFLLRMVPGDPAAMILGERATPESIAALRAELGLDLPLWQQFTDFAWGILTSLDTGNSLVTGASTRELILAKAPVSLGIVLFAVVLAVAIAVPLAFAAALRQDGWIDHVVRVLPAVGMGMPLFWVGLLLIIVFGVQLRWFPVGGVGTGPGEPLRSLFLPALAVALGMAPPLIRSLRAQLIDVLAADFVTTLRAARIPERRILGRHVLRSAALPTLTLLSVNTAYLIGGTLVVEKVFGINGLGTLLFQSIGSRDFPVVQGIALYCAVLVVLVTTLAGVLSAALDPRLRSVADAGQITAAAQQHGAAR